MFRIKSIYVPWQHKFLLGIYDGHGRWTGDKTKALTFTSKQAIVELFDQRFPKTHGWWQQDRKYAYVQLKQFLCCGDPITDGLIVAEQFHPLNEE